MTYTTLFFDLDDTLYESSNGLWRAIRDRMGEFMVEHMGLPAEEVPNLRRRYFETYGTTLRGLQTHHKLDTDEYLAFVHDLPLEDYLKPAPELRKMLLSLNQGRWIFTNADEAHARRVLSILEIEDCFEGIIDVRAVKFTNKPDLDAYRQAMQIAGETRAEACVMFDDSPMNLAPAKKLGFTTVLVGTKQPSEAVHYSMNHLLQLPEVMPELWDGLRTAE